MAQGNSFARKFGGLSFALVASAAMADGGSHGWPVVDVDSSPIRESVGRPLTERIQTKRPKSELGAQRSEEILALIRDAGAQEQRTLGRISTYELSSVNCYQSTFPLTDVYKNIPRGPQCSAIDASTGKRIQFDNEASRKLQSVLPGGFDPRLADAMRWSADRLTCTELDASEKNGNRAVVSCIVQSKPS